jgi:cell division protein FtsI/penicillin-binding protein 2
MRSARILGAAAAAFLLLPGLAACGGDGDPGPDLDYLTEALRTGDFTQVDFAGSTTPDDVTIDYDRITKGLIEALGSSVNDVGPTITAHKAVVTDRTAKARLDWRWPLGTATWSYSTEVALTKKGDDWQVTWQPDVVEPELAGEQRLDATHIAPVRGDIIGDNGVHLVTDRPVVTYGIDKTKVKAARAEQSARALAALLDIDPAAYAKKVKAAGEKAFVEAITYRRGQAPSAASRIGSIKGAVALQTSRSLGLTKEFAAPILGTVGDVTAEMIKKNPGVYKIGDVAGLSGLEARYDDRLRGTPGVEVDLVAADGTVKKQLFQADPQDGKPLRITLDDKLQTLAEQLLANVGPASALVAIRPSTGAILAAANGPGNGGANIATYGTAAPGSTFKTADSLALLRKGLTPSSMVSCPTSVTVDGKRFGNDSWYPASATGRVPLSLAIAQSCNTAMIGQRDRISHADLVSAAASLGFGVDHDTGFSSYFGQLPKPASETEHAADLIGQGKVLASPMVMAAMIASIEAGKTVVPKLVDGVHESAPGSVEPITAQEGKQLRSLFRGVVTSGTGRGLLGLPGKPVIAKTGTAEFDRDGKRLTHTWMIAAQGDLAVAVYVDEGETGSSTSGPIVESFLRGAH